MSQCVLCNLSWSIGAAFVQCRQHSHFDVRSFVFLSVKWFSSPFIHFLARLSSCPSDYLPVWLYVSNICWGSEWRYWCLVVRSSRSLWESFHAVLAAGPGPALVIHKQTHTKTKRVKTRKNTLSIHINIKFNSTTAVTRVMNSLWVCNKGVQTHYQAKL